MSEKKMIMPDVTENATMAKRLGAYADKFISAQEKKENATKENKIEEA